jgi:hypothetical protein
MSGLRRDRLKDAGLTKDQVEAVANALDAIVKAGTFDSRIAFIIEHGKIVLVCASVEEVLHKVLNRGGRKGNRTGIIFIPLDVQETLRRRMEERLAELGR